MIEVLAQIQQIFNPKFLVYCFVLFRTVLENLNVPSIFTVKLLV